MQPLEFETLGQTWLNLVERTLKTGSCLPDGLRECLGVMVGFAAASEQDPIIDQFGDPHMIKEMRQVFFEPGPNALGHSYAGLMRGPDGRSDLKDVVDLLQQQPLSKRAVLTLCGPAGGKVPCLNVVQFLIRDGSVQTTYFARGQDVFKKFYADGVCVAAMARRVAQQLGLPAGRVRGFLGSSHIYAEDIPAIQTMLDRGRAHLSPGLTH